MIRENLYYKNSKKDINLYELLTQIKPGVLALNH